MVVVHKKKVSISVYYLIFSWLSTDQSWRPIYCYSTSEVMQQSLRHKVLDIHPEEPSLIPDVIFEHPLYQNRVLVRQISWV